MQAKKSTPKPKKSVAKKSVKSKAKPKAKVKDKGGRPIKYNEGMNKTVYNLGLLKAKNTQIADSLGINIDTLSEWRKKYKRFSEALSKGREDADGLVAKNLFQNATGFSVNETDIRVIDGKIVKTTIRKNFAPNVTAQIFWLKNRQPDAWKDKQEVLQSGEIGVKVEEIAPKLDALSDEEQIQWLALHKKLRK